MMNDRIKELGRQAWAKTLESVEFYDAVGDLNEDFHIKYNQVFAELIVKECVSEIKTLRGNYDTHRDVEPEENDWYVDAFLQAEERLKQHFGVE